MSVKLSIEVKENFKDLKTFEKNLTNLVGGKDIEAGIFSAISGSEQVKIATIHEFGGTINHPGGTPYIIGTGGKAIFVKKGTLGVAGITKPHEITIPQRSFLRSTLKDNKRKVMLLFVKAYDDILKGRKTIDRAFWEIGDTFISMVRRKIRNKIAPPLKPATIRRKGSIIPLIDTGRLIQSLTFKIKG